jgi:predicted enzyme related to lactoylglutathione lyase
MFFCEEPRLVAQWWAQLLNVQTDTVTDVDGFFWFLAGDMEYGFHRADDERNPRGGTPVVYLATNELNASMRRAIAMGATAHRGPLVISSERSIAQLVDPFGNVFGLDGP